MVIKDGAKLAVVADRGRDIMGGWAAPQALVFISELP